ncbi:Glycosyltransferase involved in cell wall bisynthesis [Neorhodopirellula lusitana]|uniref:Glycosyltransferase involved in cell wall bisynthesis n=1 Tax=Neorhodopirellula lusitana TaxID=445327 RepID=A0ABY1QA80_9BACT|nr:glycosyltransferase [Neorhodopirellula lusitana]SMP62085.1 Glycosyltransferase involved in cell wall bisynthesis [Neorhodopirellula lusitana]
MNLVFWQNILSPHQVPYIRELKRSGHDVTIVADERISLSRSRMGWEAPNSGDVKVIIGPSKLETTNFIHACASDTVHVMAGARLTELGALACQEVVKSNARLGIISESPDPRGCRFYLRRSKYILERLTRGRHFDFVLGMGRKGTDWFQSCGYSKKRVFEFSYVVDEQVPETHVSENSFVRLLYVGQLIKRKGLDTLLYALAATPKELKLDIVGDGPQRSQLVSLAERLHISDQLTWHGSLNSVAARHKMSNCDALILPSYHDGWGAVVNEALCSGTPVICSDGCGASSLLTREQIGVTFPAGNVDLLREKIISAVQKGPVNRRQRAEIVNWYAKASPTSVAEYFSAIMSHTYLSATRPNVPWAQ